MIALILIGLMVILIPLWCIYQCWFIKGRYDDNEQDSDDDSNDKEVVKKRKSSGASSWGLPVRKKRFVSVPNNVYTHSV